MLASIHPLGERARGHRFGRTVIAYFVGSVVGAAVFGIALGGLGQLILSGVGRSVALVALGGLAVVAGFFDATRRRIPSWHRQVNEDWLADYRGWVYGAGFGLQLGVGVATIVTTAAVYLTWSGAFLAANPLLGGAIGAIFGLARALPVLGSFGLQTPAELGARVQMVDALDGKFRVMTVTVELLAAAALVAAAVA